MATDHQDDELRRRMSQIQANRVRGAAKQPQNPHVKEVMSWVLSVAEGFVAEDNALSIQSSNSERIFIGYGYAAVCQIRAFEQADGVRLQLRDEPRGSFSRTTGFSLPAKEEDVKKWTRNSLLDWYETVG